jgi:hypothetical protein
MSRHLGLAQAPGHDEWLLDGMVGLSSALGGLRHLMAELLADEQSIPGEAGDEALMHAVLGLASLQRRLWAVLGSVEAEAEAPEVPARVVPIRGILR